MSKSINCSAYEWNRCWECLSDPRLRRIADHYGLKKQALKTVEESGEMLTELGRLVLMLENGTADLDAYQDQANKLIEEITDTRILLLQLTYLLDKQDLAAGFYTRKVNRQLQRIEQEQQEETK